MVTPSDTDVPSTNEKPLNSLPAGYNQKQVEEGVRVLFKVLEKKQKKLLFENEGEYIFIQIACIRIPKIFKRNYRFSLPNGYLKDSSEVCLFVKNLSKGDREYEDTVSHYKEKLVEAGVTVISEVISLNQLMQEYKTYEMRRRLAARFDMFLADCSINNWLHGALGKEFHRCRKQPTPVNLRSKDLKNEIEKSLPKTTLTVTGKGAQVMTKIGHTKQAVEHICQNIEAFVKELRYTFPGKWANIRSLHIRTDDSLSVPLYYSFAPPNSVKVPKQSRSAAQNMIPKEVGELSTLPDGYEVMVLPSGDVKVKGKKADGTIGWLNDLELEQLGALDPLDDGEEEDEGNSEDEEKLRSVSEGIDLGVDLKEESEGCSTDSEENEDGMEAAEDAYLRELNIEMEQKDSKRRSMDMESETPVKKSKANISRSKKNSFFSNWKIEEIPNKSESSTHSTKEAEYESKPWEIEESTIHLAGSAKKSTSTGTKLNMNESVKNRDVPISVKAENLKGDTSKFGAKGKVSGNKLGKKKNVRYF